jgi:hypothetical protein
MSASDLTEATSTRGFKPEFHSWILIPDTASFRKESSEEDPTNAPSHDGCPEATATSDEAPETSTVNAESIILGTTTIGGLCSSLPTSPLASSCDLSSSAGSELLVPSWPLALPRPCPGALEALEGVEREERIARVICYGGADADGAPDDVQLAARTPSPSLITLTPTPTPTLTLPLPLSLTLTLTPSPSRVQVQLASPREADANRSAPPPSPPSLLPQLSSLDRRAHRRAHRLARVRVRVRVR